MERGLSQQELADKLGVVQSAVNQWEHGKRYPRLDKLEYIAKALNITTERLIR